MMRPLPNSQSQVPLPVIPESMMRVGAQGMEENLGLPGNVMVFGKRYVGIKFGVCGCTKYRSCSGSHVLLSPCDLITKVVTVTRDIWWNGI